MMKTSLTILATTLMLATPLSAHAQTIQLSNGDRLTGEIISQTAEFIEFKTDFGTFTLPTTKVVPTAAEAPAIAPSAALVPESEAPEEPGLWNAKWSGIANMGGDVTSGNSQTNALFADAEVTARWEQHRAKFSMDYYWEEDGEVVIDNRSIAGEHNYFFAPKWFYYSRAAFKQDEIASLNLRSNLGAGFGYQIFETDEKVLDINFGPSWLYHDYATDENTSAPAANWSLNYDQAIWESAFAIFHNHQLVVPLDQGNAFIIESETGVRIPLHAGLVATGEIDFDWSNAPASGATEEDITYSLKLGYEW
ncbi:MAG: DUF481 domain-containing protein [Parvibaculaceae bacterium]|nr:DUF481 domain-containing protein [Parvibaculaceae bacterium]